MRAGLDSESALCRQLLPQCGKGLLLCSLHGHGADLQPRGGLPEREALEDGEPQGCGLGSGQLIDQLLQRQLLPRPAGSQLRLRRSQLLELNGEANNFADGGVPSLGRHRLLTHHPPSNRSHASSTSRWVRYSPNWRISLF